jgi:lipopolysaccharide export system protein LptA
LYRNLSALKHEIKVTFVLLILFSQSGFIAYAQNTDRLEYKAKILEGGVKDGVSYKKLTGNVVFTQKNTIIYCDSAFFYDKTNSTEAFGRVRIEDLEDSVTITSKRLNYDGNGRTAQLRGDVVYIDDSIRLYTDNLDYDMVNKSAVYFDGGRINDGINTMHSKRGNYDTEGKMMIFHESVRLITPDYTLESDDLFYNIATKKARTSTATKITTNDGKVLNSQKSSEFDTRLGAYVFLEGEIDTEKYYIKGDELFYNSALGSYTAVGNVYLFAKTDEVIITGQKADFWEEKGIARIYGDPLMKKLLNQDTMFLRADTLISIDDSLEVNKRLLAFRNVKIFKSDLQGKADSLAYFLADSSIVFYNDPILWNDGSQITADTIQILVKDGTIDKLNARVNSFIISEDSTKNFNQIKGRLMTAYFNGKSIKNVDVTGNGETIYFVADDENAELLIGMNRIVCTNMKIGFLDDQVNDIRFYTNPDGKFIPPHELKDDIKKLEGFAWRSEERPTKTEILINPFEAKQNRLEEGIYQGESGELDDDKDKSEVQKQDSVTKSNEVQPPENQAAAPQ